MRIEVDQSGKIEDTSKHTFLAFSNTQRRVLKISSVEKRKLQKYFKDKGKSKIFIYITFASLVIILLKNLKLKNIQIIIDVEYTGRGHLIKNLKSINPTFPTDDICFHQIGKKSHAHYLTYGAAIRKLNPDLIITANRVLNVIKKSGSA